MGRKRYPRWEFGVAVHKRIQYLVLHYTITWIHIRYMIETTPSTV
jgi:hypothetical protein